MNKYSYVCLMDAQPYRQETGLDADQAKQIAGMFHLLGEPNRLRIVVACLSGDKSVNDLARIVGISPSLASHNLRLLKAARLVKPTRRGKFVDYSVHDHHVREILTAMIDHASEPMTEATESV